MYLKIYLYWLKVGIYALGSGYAVIPYLFNFYKINNYPISELKMFISASQMCPGPIVVNIATISNVNNSGLIPAIISIMGLITMPIFLLSLYILNFKKLKSMFREKLEFYLIPLVTAILIYSMSSLIYIHKISENFILYILAFVLITFRIPKSISMFLLGILKLVLYYV